jgi:hypothetical protein
MPFSVIPRLDRGIQKVLENTGSPGPAFAMAMDGQACRGMTNYNFCNVLLRSLYDADL